MTRDISFKYCVSVISELSVLCTFQCVFFSLGLPSDKPDKKALAPVTALTKKPLQAHVCPPSRSNTGHGV